MKLEELQMELIGAKELKQVLESRLICMEAEARTMSVKVDSLEVKFQNERALSAEFAAKCQELEEELSRTKQEVEQKTASSNGELKIKQVRHHLLLLTTYISSTIFYQLFAGYCRNISLPYISQS